MSDNTGASGSGNRRECDLLSLASSSSDSRDSNAHPDEAIDYRLLVDELDVNFFKKTT